MDTMEEKNPQETSKLWEQIRSFYKYKFGYEPDMVDIMADYEIIKLCASGSSNKSISKFLNIEDDDTYTPVSNCIDRHLGFSGWEEDLPFSPLKVFYDLERKSVADFIDAIADHVSDYESNTVYKMYMSARYVYNIERLIDEKWI